MKLHSLFIITALFLSIAACGGGDSYSGGEESLAQEREALACVSLVDKVVTNTCDYAIVFRVFSGANSTPATIQVGGTYTVNGLTSSSISYGACRSPYTPVDADIGYECL